MMADAANRKLSAASQLSTLVAAQIGLLLRARKTRALLVVQLLPVIAALIFVVFDTVDGLTMFSAIVDVVTIPLLIPLAAIFFGGPAIVEELEERTLTYLTLRPMDKAVLYLGKVIAAVAVCLPLVLLPLLVLFLVCLGQSPDWSIAMETFGQLMLGAGLGVVGYTTLFALLGAAFASGLLVSIVYFVVIEMGFSMLPIVEILTVRFHIRTTAELMSGQPGLLDRLVSQDPLVLDWYWGGAILLAVSVAAIAVGAWAFRERQYHV